MRKTLATGLFSVFIAAAGAATAAPPSTIDHEPLAIPLGHPDFYPSPDRPFAWRGDGTAAWPGATPVTHWQEGTPKRIERSWGPGDNKAKNIVWRTRMPCFSNSQPVVAGDRVFTTAEPHFLICVDVNTGKILWVRENNPFDFMGKSEEEADALLRYMQQVHVIHGLYRNIVGGYSRHPETATSAQLPLWRKLADWTEHVLLEMNRGPYAAAVQEALHAMDDHLCALASMNHGDPSEYVEKALGIYTGSPAVWMNENHGIRPCSLWDGWIGWTFSAPVTDGEFVYTSMGNGQVACYDLAGNRMWARRLPTTEKQGFCTRGGTMGGNNCTPPKLVDGVLCVYVTTGPKDCDGLYGFDAKTGNTLWSTADQKAFQGVARGSGWLRIPRPNGTILHALASNRGSVIRVTDGKILAFHGLGYNHGPDAQGHSDIVVGNRWYVNEKSSLVAFELSATNDDKVTFKQLWKTPIVQYCRSPILYGDYFLRLGKGNEIIRLSDGKPVFQDTGKAAIFTSKVSYSSPIVAGDYLIGFSPGGRRDGQPLHTLAQVLEIGKDGKPRMLADKNVMDGEPIVHMPRFETMLPGYKPGDVVNNTGGTPKQFGYASPVANANRIFMRSVSHLYCIGDPKAPYSWNPASRPKHITDKLKAAGKALAERDPVEALKSPYAWDREAGRQAIAKMSAAEQKVRLNRIAALTAGDGWRTLKAACATLRDLGSAASPALEQLRTSLEKWITAKNLDRSVELLMTIRSVAPEAAKPIVPKLAAALRSGDADSMIVAARLAAIMAGDAEALSPDLTKALASDSDTVAREVAITLRTIGLKDADTVPALAAATGRKYRWTTIAALDALAARGPAAVAALGAITESLKNKDVRIIMSAEKAVASLGPKAKPAVPALLSVLKNDDIRCAVQAADTVSSLGPTYEKQLSSQLIKNLAGKDDVVCKSNARAIGNVGPTFKTMAHKIDSIEALIKALKTRSTTVKREAAISLGKFGTTAEFAADALRHAALGKECTVQAKAALAKVAPGTNLKKRIEPESEVDIDDLGF